MKISRLLISTAVLSIAAAAQADRATLNAGPGYGGGSFTATILKETGSPFGGPAGATFQTRTFCLESTSYFNPGTQYYAQYSMSATPGGGGASGGQDPISTATAWLFSKAVQATLSWTIGATTTNFNVNDMSHNKAVQAAIWQLEGETNPFTLTTAEQAIRDAVRTKAQASAVSGFYWGVQVMRLWTSRSGSPGSYTYSGDRQDQLVLIPLPPAVWGGAGMMAGVVGLAYVRRRKQQA